MSKREMNKARNRNRLIASATTAFAESGVKGANINLISLEAGLGKGTVYNYFPSKKELFLGVINSIGHDLAAALKGLADDGGSLTGHLKALTTGLFSFYGADADRAKLAIRTVADHRVERQRAVMAAFAPFLDPVQAALTSASEKGELRADLDPFISAVTLWGLINHQAAFHWLVSSRSLESEPLAELVLIYFMDGVLAG